MNQPYFLAWLVALITLLAMGVTDIDSDQHRPPWRVGCGEFEAKVITVERTADSDCSLTRRPGPGCRAVAPAPGPPGTRAAVRASDPTTPVRGAEPSGEPPARCCSGRRSSRGA